MAEEHPLAGGTTDGVVRVGDTVRRPRTERSAAVEALLVHLHEVGAEVAPRFLGVDEQGRQVLAWVEGETPSGPPFDLGDARIVSAVRLVRRFHDAVRGTTFAADQETVCHGDLGPHNTVFRGDVAVRILDWDDDVRPGRRADDVAQGIWGFADLVEPQVPVAEQARRLALCCDADGEITREQVVEELLARFGRARTQHTAAGRDEAVRIFADLETWLREHRDPLLDH